MKMQTVLRMGLALVLLGALSGCAQLPPRSPGGSFQCSPASFTPITSSAVITARELSAASSSSVTAGQQYCCPASAHIASWQIGFLTSDLINTTRQSSHGSLAMPVGYASAVCSDYTMLPPICTQFNSNLRLQMTGRATYPYSFQSMHTPADQDFSSWFDALFPDRDHATTAGDKSSPPVCPPGEIAIGYSARSQGVVLENLQVLCGKQVRPLALE